MKEVKINFCCGTMDDRIEDGKDIAYDSSIRAYYLLLTENEYGTHQSIFYCPWCGVKLPTSLNSIWGKILKEEYGLDDPCIDDADKVPEEFKTDEWWKKRGL